MVKNAKTVHKVISKTTWCALAGLQGSASLPKNILYLMVIKYVISSSVFGQKTHTNFLNMVKFLGGGLQGVAASPCLKEIIHDGNKISNFIHSLVQTFGLKPTKTENKTKQNKNKNKNKTNQNKTTTKKKHG